MFSIEIEGLPKALQTLSEIQKAIEKESPKEVVKILLGLWDKGLDVEGIRFLPYSPTTKVIRKKKGRQTGLVDLKFTGQMRKDLKAKSEKGRGFSISFKNGASAKKMYFIVNSKNKRIAFGWGKRLTRIYLQALNARIREIIKRS